MLKVFRDNLKHLKWILVLVVLVFVFFIWADFGTGLGNQNAGGRPNVAAYVGDQEVTFGEFERTYRDLEGFYGQIYGDRMTPELARQIGLPLQALNQAVSKKILLAEAKDMGLTVSDDELRDRILQEQLFKDEQGRFVGEDRYVDIVRRRLGYPSSAAFEEVMREELLVAKLSDILEANVFVSDKEVEEAYREQVERASIRYIQLPVTRFAESVTPTDAEIKAHFDRHKQEYQLPEQRDAAYLLVDPAQLAGKVAVDEKALRDYFADHREEFARPEQVHARHILIKTQNGQHSDAEAQQLIQAAHERIKKGEALAAVAREVSEDSTKATGGDLGFFGRGAMAPPFEQAAFGAQPGTVVGPVKTQFGYHLIEVVAKQAAGTQPFEQAREMIRQRLGAERAAAMAETKARALARRLAQDKPKSPDALKGLASPAEGVTSGETGPFSRQEPVGGIGYAPAFTNAAFALEKGGVSEAVQTPRGWAVLYLKDVKPPRIPELKDVEPRVRLALVRQKQQTMAQQQLEQAKQAGKTLDQIAAELGLEVKESSEFGPQGSIPGIGVNPGLAKAALALNAGQMGGPVSDAQGAILFEVKERKSWDPIQFAAAREQTRDTVRRQKLNELEGALIEQRRRELDVRFPPEVLEEYGITAPAANPAG